MVHGTVGAVVTSTPLVTVCIPSYNHGAFLSGAIDSVLEQTYGNVECIVFDDGSTDDSWEIAQSYAVRDPRVRPLSHERRCNRGIAATLNAAYAQAQGNYVSNLAADDMLLPDSVERRVDVLRAGSDFVYGRIEMLDATGRATGRYGGVSPDDICRFDNTDDALRALLLHDFIPSPTVLLRRDLILRVGGFHAAVYYNDWELWIRLIARRTQFAFVGGAPLVRCRPGAYGDDADLPRRLELFRALDGELAASQARLVEPRIRALIRLQRAAQAAQIGYDGEASAAIRSALEADEGLRSATDDLLWWLTPLQRRRLPVAQEDGAEEWLRNVADPRVSLADSIAAGARAGHFGCWAVEAAGSVLSADKLESLRWGLIANELELAGSRPELRFLAACAFRAIRQPGLLRERWFVKAVLCECGLWPLLARIRRTLAAGAA